MVSKKAVQPRVRENRYKKKQKRSYSGVASAFRVILLGLCGAVGIFFLSIVFVFGHDWATQCDYLRAQSVKVEGCSYLTEREVRQAAGITEGVNILSVNLARARLRVMSMGWVAEAEIRREFPDFMIIRIREHKPVAVINLGKPFLVNDKAEIFKEADAGQFAQLPVIRGVNYADWQSPGKEKTSVGSSVMSLLRVCQKHNSVFGDQGIAEITVDPDLGLAVLPRLLPVEQLQMGYGDYEKKIGRLEKVLSHLKTSEPALVLEKIDLRNPDRIVARPLVNEESFNTRRKEA